MTPIRSSVAAIMVSGALISALTGSVVASPTSAIASQRASGNLTVTPSTGFVAGQAQTYRGTIGAPGKRRIWLEANLNRPGDQWVAVEGTATSTRSDGSFTISRPAPSMFGISFRVVGQGGYATPGVKLTGATQELFIWAAADTDTEWTDAIQPAAGEPFVVAVDTTPEMLHRTDLKGLPTFPGRTLTLQSRLTGETWTTIGTTTVRNDGMGYFEGVAEPEIGRVFYRVRQERIYTGANRIGWHASFPLALDVAEEPSAYEWWESTPTSTVKSLESGAADTAGRKYGWNPRFYDFDWELGQDLDEKPTRGTKLRGTWIPYSDGGGRGSVQNGQLVLFSSVSGRSSTGDFGTTRLTQSGNARTHGRWEVRMRWQVLESVKTDYQIKVELVPQGTSGVGCAARSIVIGSWSPRGNTVDVGVARDGKFWKSPVSVPTLRDKAPAVAVEVTPSHTTWFINGQAVRTLTDTSSALGKKLVLRLSLSGGSEEHNSTKVFSDWQRGFGLTKGKQKKASAKVPSSPNGFC